MHKIILTGGGTGGHVIPNLALVPYLRKHFSHIDYVGSNNPERNLALQADIPFYSIPAIKFDRSKILRNFKIPFFLLSSIKEAKSLLRKLQPTLIFSKGGYVSLPICFAARQLKIPIVIHESDSTFGLANKIVSSFATVVLTSFENKKGIYTGNPIRNEIFMGNKTRARKKYNIKKNHPIILIMGGSSGSTAINEIVYQSLPALTKKYFVIHISGKHGKLENIHNNYLQMEYASDINDLYALANIVISRAGANALSELMALGKKTIVIPLPKSASRGDQIKNAQAYSNKKNLCILPQEELSASTLTATIDKLYKTPIISKIRNISVNDIIVKNILKAIPQKA